MSLRHQSYWLDRPSKTRRPSFERFRGQASTRVVIIGAGLTGCAAAFAFASAGIDVIVLEEHSIGGGSTAGSAGLLREGLAASFRDAASAHGLRAARALWQSMQRASKDMQAVIRRAGIRCDLEVIDLLEFAAPQGFAPVPVDGAKVLRREYQERCDAGLDHTWITAARMKQRTTLATGGAIRTHAAGIDPYRACLGLAAAAVKRGAVVHEQSAAIKVRPARGHVEVATAAGIVRAESVIVTTGRLVDDLRALRRHLDPRDVYTVVTAVLPPRLRREAGTRDAALRDDRTPPHVLRFLQDDRVLFAGAAQAPVPPRVQDKALVQRTGQLMYELSTLFPAISGLQPEWSWRATHHHGADGLPLVGPHRNFPRHLFALAGEPHGPAYAWLAARVLLRHFMGEATRDDEHLGFQRVL